MGKGTAIEWADHTFNGWWGCHESSPACDHCYAREWAKFTGHHVWGIDAPRRFFGDAHWNEPLKWNREAADAGVRARVFAFSMADWCEPRPDLDPWRAKLAALIEATAHLDWLLLTKWPELITRSVPASWLKRPPINVQYGTTAEDQLRWNRRVLALQLVPAHRRFISVEPMLGPILTRPSDFTGIHQVIVGGESSKALGVARPMHPQWARSLRDDTLAAGVAFHFKQWGNWIPMSELKEDASTLYDPAPKRDPEATRRCKVPTTVLQLDGARELTFPKGAMQIFEVGKKRAGRELDGRTWDEFPTSNSQLPTPNEVNSAR